MRVDSWFADFLSDIRLTSGQVTELKEGHTRLTERIKADEDLAPLIVSTFLQGSYRRATAVRPNGDKRADVDVIVVTNLREEDYPDPEEAMKLFLPVMERHYKGKYKLQGRSIGISMSKIDLDVVVTSAPSEVDQKALSSESARSTASLEEARDWRFSGSWVSPEHRTSASAQKSVEAAQTENEWQIAPLRIPDREAKRWDDTHPLEQNRWTREKNRLTEGNYVNVVKALKWWRVEKLTDLKYPKGYPIEHMIGDCCPDGVTSMAECVTLTLEEAVRRYQADALALRTPVLPDRGVPGHNVWGRLTGNEFATFYNHVVQAAGVARGALDAAELADQVEAWQQLFGGRFPDPPPRARTENGGGPGGTGGFTKRDGPGYIGGGRFGLMPDAPEPSDELRAGRRALATVAECEILHDFVWEPTWNAWRLHIRLRAEPGQFIPAETEWHVRVAPTYPWGQIDLYPDADCGIRETFQHQDYNRAITGRPFWSGKLCVATALRGVSRRGYDKEPYDVEERLRWYIKQALDWVRAAATGDLVRAGEPYELPSFDLRTGTVLAFNEDRVSLDAWNQIPDRSGVVRLRGQGNDPHVHIATEFLTVRGRVLYTPAWGAFLARRDMKDFFGIWMRLEDTPVLPPWRAPMTWGEMRQVFEAQQMDLDSLLRPAVSAMHGKVQAGYGVLGFPIPAEIGGDPAAIHWQAFRIPTLGKRPPAGFRNNEASRWAWLASQHFTETSPIKWAVSENWMPDQLSTRGRLPEELRDQSVAVLGAGALGSAVAELLLRAGVHRVVIVDGGLLEAGNLARHTLLLSDVPHGKAKQLAARLNAASPSAQVHGIGASFPDFTQEQHQRIAGCDLILDLTGDDQLLRHVDSYPWRAGQTFISGSLGMGSKRLFCYSSKATDFSHRDFQARLAPWLETELVENAGCRLPREGLGCWHPVFPARIDDVWMMAAVLVKYITDRVGRGAGPADLTVFEQVEGEHGFSGVRRIAEESHVA